MSPVKKLSVEDLTVKFNLPKFKNTSEIKPEYKLIDQDRAIDAINFALDIQQFGYNIYVCGYEGIGKRSYLIDLLKKRAKDEKTPSDWIYVYNFEDVYKPLAIELKPGTANILKNDLNQFVDELCEEITELFSSEEYEKRRNDLIDYYEKMIIDLADELNEKSKEKKLIFKYTNDGFAFIPINCNNKEMTEQEYIDLPDEEKEQINKNVSDLRNLAYEILRKTKALKKEMNQKLKDLEFSFFTLYIEDKISSLIDKYNYNDKLVKYFNSLKNDIIDNLDVFIDIENVDKDFLEAFLSRYDVNVFVNNLGEGAPVIIEETPEYQKLIGLIEYENKSGNLVTDFTMIQPGSLHYANGGYLVVDARKLLESFWGYEALKRTLMLGKITIENFKNQLDIIPIENLKPEAIPIKTKVIMIGSPEIYYLLYNYDEDFKKLFKIKAEFNNKIKDNYDNINCFLKLIKYLIDEKKFKDITYEGVQELVYYSKKLSENKNYLTSNISNILEILEQANHIAKNNKRKFIDQDDIKAALIKKEKRNSLIRDEVIELYENNKYLIDVKGYKVGQVNALSVIDYGDYEFGRVNRVTVNTFSGVGNIINIDREVGLSGSIFNKAILILTGYIGERFGKVNNLSFNASICFEQMYGEIDGDSATLAETVALISSLAEVPINQGIAITGSVNQKGTVQAVGGVNTKIRGYFDICRLYGLDGTQGVIIPESNLDDLVLDDDIIEAVKENMFSIYTVTNVEDCFDIILEPTFKKGRKNKNFDLIEEKILKRIEKLKEKKEKSKKE
ncbi:Lon protease family protein [Caloramator proteoclasticus]|uniref:endopeptidase La n=1 Tax=Caloramator proteoclasticus DSM 10124 TaxID=1121262 RepID=A0A1M4TFN2_9CLOT|nr:ATP-binding protein [Caloramator proteoclasticus]SHE43312.1 lon-related putative ATP-dependent protease [Caloramator proteoclasticus DSM 10124]